MRVVIGQNPVVCCPGKLLLLSFIIACQRVNVKRRKSLITALKPYFPIATTTYSCFIRPRYLQLLLIKEYLFHKDEPPVRDLTVTDWKADASIPVADLFVNCRMTMVSKGLGNHARRKRNSTHLNNDRGKYVSSFSFVQVVCLREGDRLILGLHFLGPSAGEVIQGFAAAMR